MESLLEAAGLVILGMFGEKILRKNDKYKNISDKPVDYVCDHIVNSGNMVSEMRQKRKYALMGKKWIKSLDKDQTEDVSNDIKELKKTFGSVAKTEFQVCLGKAVEDLGDKSGYEETLDLALQKLTEVNLDKAQSLINKVKEKASDFKEGFKEGMEKTKDPEPQLN